MRTVTDRENFERRLELDAMAAQRQRERAALALLPDALKALDTLLLLVDGKWRHLEGEKRIAERIRALLEG